MAQWVWVPTSEPDGLSSILRTHRLEGESWLLQGILCLPQKHCGISTLTCAHMHMHTPVF